jgi:hypothetical protein
MADNNEATAWNGVLGGGNCAPADSGSSNDGASAAASVVGGFITGIAATAIGLYEGGYLSGPKK